MENLLFNLDNMSDMQACLAMLLCMKNDSQSIMEEIELIFEKEKKFWGYDAEQSDAPPKDKTLGEERILKILAIYILRKT